MNDIIKMSNFTVIQDDKSHSIQIWMDWTPSLEVISEGKSRKTKEHASVFAPFIARADNGNLVLDFLNSEDSGIKKTTRIFELNPNILDMINSYGAELVICGATGVLSKKKIEIENINETQKH